MTNHINMPTTTKSHVQRREQVRQQVADFLNSGGTITMIESAVMRKENGRTRLPFNEPSEENKKHD